MQIENLQFEPDGVVEDDTKAIIFTLKATKREKHEELLRKIRKVEGIVHVEEI